MSADSEFLPPPDDADTFESLCWDLWKSILGTTAVRKNCRRGQPQAGVDVFGPSKGGWLGIQCKQKSSLSGKDLTPQELDVEVGKALTFEPPLQQFIVATTRPASGAVQRRARELTDKHFGEGLFSVEVWDWHSLWSEIYGRQDLLARIHAVYWPGLLRATQANGRRSSWSGRDHCPVDISRMPSTDYNIRGRTPQLRSISLAWRRKSCRWVSVIGYGGNGKTALVNRWLQDLSLDKKQSWGGADSVFAWSFVDSSLSSDASVSSEEFFTAAFRFFDIPDPGAAAGRQKAQILAMSIRDGRHLLILDGLECLQQQPTATDEGGHILDDALFYFLRTLGGSCFCVLTSRLPLSDLSAYHRASKHVIQLERLDAESGGQVIRDAIQGNSFRAPSVIRDGPTLDVEFRNASEEFGGHALALRLLGKYLSIRYNGDIRRRHEIGPLIGEDGDGAHAARLMRDYAAWYEGRPELQTLQLLALFDRPAESGALDALRKPPQIFGLTDKIVDVLGIAQSDIATVRDVRDRLPNAITGEDWNQVLWNLQSAGLIALKGGGSVDCHALVREFFGKRHRSDHIVASLQGHSRLFEYFRDLPFDFLPSGRDEAESLYRSMYHGCKAELFKPALNEVYKPRLRREQEAWCLHTLGAYHSDISAMFGFFEASWERPQRQLDPEDAGFVLSGAGFCLRAVGRMNEAIQVTRASLVLDVQLGDLRGLALDYRNLAQMRAMTGDLQGALRDAKKGVEAADHAAEGAGLERAHEERMVERVTLAWVLHQMGSKSEAFEVFKRAEEIQRVELIEPPFLYSQGAFRYVELLIELGQLGDATVKNEHALGLGLGWNSGLDLALLKLNHCRLSAVNISGNDGDFSDLLEECLIEVQSSCRVDCLPIALLSRAEFFRNGRRYEEAWVELEEVFETVLRCGMKLFEVDCHLECVRLKLDTRRYRWKRAKSPIGAMNLSSLEHLRAAEQLVRDCGYNRRKDDLAELIAKHGL